MAELGFICPGNESAAAAIPPDIQQPEKEVAEKTVFWWLDESCFHANEDQPIYWGDGTMRSIHSKSQGAGLMVSDFIEDKAGYLSLSDELYEQQNHSFENQLELSSSMVKHMRDIGITFMEQVKAAVDNIAEVKYPPSSGYNHVCLFDQSCGHTAMAADALVASRLNRNPGGCQPAMRDTMWAGRVEK